MKNNSNITSKTKGTLSPSAPVYTATESRSSTVDFNAMPPRNTVAPKATGSAPRRSTDEGQSQLARNRATSTSAPLPSTADADENGVTYKPMRAFEVGGKVPRASPDDHGRSIRRSPQAQGTTPILMDGASAPLTTRRPSARYTPTDAELMDMQLAHQQQLEAEQQMMQQQYLSALARARFMSEIRAQQMWMQQQQAAAQQQQYNENLRRWMGGDLSHTAQANRGQNGGPYDYARSGSDVDNASQASRSVHGSFMSILTSPSKQRQQQQAGGGAEDDDNASTTRSAADSASNLYGDLSNFVVDDALNDDVGDDGTDGAADDTAGNDGDKAETEADPKQTSREVQLDTHSPGACGGGDVVNSDDDGESGLAKQSSLFDIVPSDTHDRSVAASATKRQPRRFTTARTLSLGVLVEPSREPVLNITNGQTIAVTDTDTKVVYDYELDEVTQYVPINTGTIDSDLLKELSRHTLEGHRSVLLASISDGAEQGGEAIVRSALCNIVSPSGADESHATPPRVDASAVVLRRGEVVNNLLAGLANGSSAHSLATYSISGTSSFRDTTDAPENDMDDGEASFTSVVSAANPVAGHWLADTTFVRLRNERDVNAVVMAQILPWLQKSANDAQAAKENLAIFVTVVQEKSAGTALYLSSLLILMTRSPDEAYRACTRPQKLPSAMEKLLKRVGHGVFTVAACCLSSSAGGSVHEYAASCRSLQAVHNSSMLSGNVQRYLSYAKGQHTKASARLAELREHNESPEAIAFAAQALRIHGTAIKDMEELIADPQNAPVRFISDATATQAEKAEKAYEEEGSKAAATGELPPVAAAEPAVTPGSAGSKSAPADSPQSVRPNDEWRELREDNITKPSPQALALPLAAPAPASSPAASVSFADCRIHVVAVIDNANSGYTIGDRASPSGGSDSAATKMTIVQTSSRRTHTVDEAVSAESVTNQGTPFSQHVTALCRNFASGYNAALISYDGRTKNLFESPGWAAVREAVRCTLEVPTNTRDLRLSVTLLNHNGEAADLLVSASEYRPITIVASPLFGAVVDGARLVPIYSENDVRELLFTVAANIGNRWPGDTCLHVSLVSSLSLHSDVMVASFKASIFGSHHHFCSQVLSSGSAKPITALHRMCIQGIAAAVLLVAFNNEHDADHARHMIEDVGELPQKQPLRDGSVRVFVHETRKSLAKRSENAARMTNAEERHRAEKVNRKIESMVSDYEETLYEPATNFPKSYTNSSDSAVTGIAAGARAVQAAGNKKQQKLHPYLVIGLENSGTVASRLRVNGHGVTWSATGENFDTDDVVVHFSRTDSAGIAAAFNTTGELERLASCAKTGKSAYIFGLTDLGSSSTAATPRPVQLQPWWLAYRNALTPAVFTENWESGSSVQLRAVVLQDKLIVHDFLRTPPATMDAGVPVKIAVSPIFGSLVSNATMQEVTDAESLRETIALLESRMNDYRSQRDNTVVVVHALLRRVRQNVSVESAPIGTGLVATTKTHDVVLSTLGAVVIRTSHDLPALREILALDPQGTVPYSLFRFPLTGTCRTVCVVDLDSCPDARATEALRLAQRIRYCNTLPVPSGSVYNYVSYESKRLDNESSAVAAEAVSMTSPAAMATTMKAFLDKRGDGAIPLFDVQDAHTVATGAGSVSPKSHGVGSLQGDGTAEAGAASKRQACKTVVVVTNREVVSPTAAASATARDGRQVQADAQARTATLGDQRYTFAEVTVRADNASVARPDLIRSAANNAIHGYNVALLMVDGTGSSCVSALLSRTINLILSNKTERKLYLSMVALRHRQGRPDLVKDMLRVGDYIDLEMATSPLFGSCINGARFSQIKNTGDIFVTLRDALSVCAVEKSVLVATLVMRQKDVLYSDVTVNSLTAVICNTDNTPADQFCGAFLEDALMEPDAAKRGLLKTCCGGQPYYTYGVIGVSGKTPPAEAKRLLDLGDRISKLMCRFPQPSSAAKLVMFAKKRLAQSAGKQPSEPSTPTATGGEFIEEPHWDWERIREDTEKMLKDESCTPKAYILE